MKNFILFFIFAVISVQVMAIDAYTIRQIRDPIQFKARLDADLATLAAGVGINAVTNGSIAISRAVVTATAVVTPQTFVPALSMVDGTTNTVAFMTNGTVAVTVVNGGLVVTNIVLTLQTN